MKKGAEQIGRTMVRLLRPRLGKKSFRSADFFALWDEQIADPAWEGFVFPGKVEFPPKQDREGTLTLFVYGDAYAVEVQHKIPQILQKIKTYFGFPLISKIKIRASAVALSPEELRPPETPLPPLSAAEKKRIEEASAKITDPDLRATLQTLWTRTLQEEKE